MGGIERTVLTLPCAINCIGNLHHQHRTGTGIECMSAAFRHTVASILVHLPDPNGVAPSTGQTSQHLYGQHHQRGGMAQPRRGPGSTECKDRGTREGFWRILWRRSLLLTSATAIANGTALGDDICFCFCFSFRVKLTGDSLHVGFCLAFGRHSVDVFDGTCMQLLPWYGSWGLTWAHRPDTQYGIFSAIFTCAIMILPALMYVRDTAGTRKGKEMTD